MWREGLARVFPAVIDTRFPGHPVALYAFYAVTALTLWRSVHHIAAPDGGAQSIASIRLDTFGPGAAETVVTMFALWGISQLVLAFVYLAAALRYRAMIPALWVAFTLEYALRLSLVWFKPGVDKAATAPGEVGNVVFLLLGPVFLALSVLPRR